MGVRRLKLGTAPVVQVEVGFRLVPLMGLSVAMLLGGVVAGAGLKASSDRRRKMRLMRFIEEGGDGQGAFVSEVRQSITGGDAQ